jgi:hypothetical protein
MPSTQSTGSGWSPSDGERGGRKALSEARHGQDRARGCQDSGLQCPEGAQGARAPALLLAPRPQCCFTVFCLSTGFSCGGAEDDDESMPELGHGDGHQFVLVPRLIEDPLAGKEVIGAAAGSSHTAAWTEEGELFTFGYGNTGKLGHGGEERELVQRLVEALTGKKVIGVEAGDWHTIVWTDEGELFTFGCGGHGRLGHGGEEDEDAEDEENDEFVPRLVQRLHSTPCRSGTGCTPRQELDARPRRIQHRPGDTAADLRCTITILVQT